MFARYTISVILAVQLYGLLSQIGTHAQSSVLIWFIQDMNPCLVYDCSEGFRCLQLHIPFMIIQAHLIDIS